MGLRGARLAKEKALGAVTPLALPEYRDLVPDSRAAKEIMNEWRPALYGYGSVLADQVASELLRGRQRPFQFSADARWELTNERASIQRMMHLDYAPTTTQLLKQAKFASGIDLDKAVDAVMDRKPSTPRDAVVRGHLAQVVSMFGYLKAGADTIYSSPRRFVRSGLSTATQDVGFKFNAVVAQVMGPDTSVPDLAAIAERSPFVTNLAALNIRQMLSALSALSGSRGFDRAAFHAVTTRSGTVVEPVLPLVELLAPLGPEYFTQTVTDPLDGRTVIGDLPADPEFPERETVGCLALLKGEGGAPSAIRNLLTWMTDVWVTGGLFAEQQRGRALRPDPEGESIGGRMALGSLVRVAKSPPPPTPMHFSLG